MHDYAARVLKWKRVCGLAGTAACSVFVVVGRVSVGVMSSVVNIMWRWFLVLCMRTFRGGVGKGVGSMRSGRRERDDDDDDATTIRYIRCIFFCALHYKLLGAECSGTTLPGVDSTRRRGTNPKM